MQISFKSVQSPYNLMRKCGYHPRGTDKKTGQMIFARRLGVSDYPRFHAYLKLKEGRVVINLHLDQKKPVYKGTPAHGAEYEGGVVEREAERIKQVLGL